MLTIREAADYCGLTTKKFQHLCKVSPVQFPDADLRYDMRDLDGWLDSLKADAPDDDDDIIGKLGK